MSGGTMKVCTQGNSSTTTVSFSINAKNFTMSGGNIIISKPSTSTKAYSAYYTQNGNITGGTLTCSPTSTGIFKVEGNIPSLAIDGANDIVTLMNDTKVYGDISVSSGATLDINGVTLYSKGNIVNDGTIQAPFSVTDTSKLYLFGTTQIYSGSGVCGTAASPIANLILNNSSTFDLSTASNHLNINKLYFYSGNLTGSNNLEIGNTLGTYSLIQYGSNGPATAGGNMDAAPIFNIGSGGLAVLYCNETNVRTIGFEIPLNRTLNQLTLISNNVTLAGGDLYVTSFLQFSSGKINLGNNNLILEATISIGGEDNNGYVVTNGTGNLTRKGVGNSNKVTFPVGTTTTYDPASIKNSGTTDDFSVNVSSTLDAFSPMPNKYIQRQWNISEATTGGSNVTLYLTCAAGVPTNNFDAAGAVQIGHYKSPNVWERITATMTNSVATASNITSFSPFVIINENAVLPVELIDFKGVASGKQNKISWSTASEYDTKCFILERRNNYGDFTSLDFVAAMGHTNQTQFYEWVDNAPVPLSMYRLKIMDLNGSYEYSKVISVENAERNAMMILHHFNKDELSIRLTDVPMGEARISIFDMQGKDIYIQNIDIHGITTDIKLSINNLPNGQYIVICNIAGQILSKKWVKI
jgi:hypothetical protein